MRKVNVKGRVIEKALAKRNVTQRDFAKKIKTSYIHLYQVLKDMKGAGPHMRARILEALPEFKWDDLFEISEE
jgi:predicted transcriptional regulator